MTRRWKARRLEQCGKLQDQFAHLESNPRLSRTYMTAGEVERIGEG